MLVVVASALVVTVPAGARVADLAADRVAVANLAKACSAQRAAVKRFKGTMAARRRAFFRAHRPVALRRGFVKRQRSQLKVLERRLARCQREAMTPPPAPEPETTPVRLSIESPLAETWFDRPTAAVRGTAAGVSTVTCNDRPAAVSGSTFACDVVLVEGPNTLVVRAIDGAGNARTAERRIHYGPGLLAGASATLVHEAVSDFDSGKDVAATEVSADAHGLRVARTRLEIAFGANATVQDVNRTLSLINGRVSSMLEGVGIMVVDIPDPGSLLALDVLAARLEAEPAVRTVRKATMGDVDMLPGNYGGTAGGSLDHIAHHLAVRAPAAWNARAAIDPNDRPTVIVGDKFLGGPPNGDLDVDEPPLINFTGTPEAHGYHVAGIIAGRFDGVATPLDLTPRGLVTGIFPATSRLLAVEAVAHVDLPTFEDRLIASIRRAPGNVVVNTSINDCATDGTCSETIRAEAVAWIEKVRGKEDVTTVGAGLENKFLHLTSAGNMKQFSPLSPATNSPYAAARLLGGLSKPGLSVEIPNLTNTLVVENAIGSGGPGIECLNLSSKRPGDIAAVGTHVFSFTDNASSAAFEGGTSMATPQVAGLAAYAWAVDPSLTPRRLARLLRSTASTKLPAFTIDADCDPVNDPSPVIDAYDALLALDAPVAPARGSAPAREAILDVDENGVFDKADLAAFEAAYFTSGVPVTPTSEDYSRFDLNGDGFGGGNGTARLDLDRVGSTQFEAAKYSTVARPDGIPVRFDENKLTDLDVLCYYAYSPLYTPADRDARRATLGEDRCLELGLEPTFPATVPAGDDVELEVKAVDLDLNDAGGDPLPQAGVRIELAATGGMVADEAGVTGADGMFTTSATLDAREDELRIEVVARAGDGGPELARVEVVAGAAAGVFLTRLDGLALAQARTSGGVFVQDEEIKESDRSDLPFSLDASARAPGPRANAVAHATSVVDRLVAGGATLSLGASGGADAATTFTDLAIAAAGGKGGVEVDFTVVGGPRAFRASGTVSGSGADPFCRVRLSGRGLEPILVHSCAAGAFTASGILPPGEYGFSVSASAGVPRIGEAESEAGSSAVRYDVSFDVGP